MIKVTLRRARLRKSAWNNKRYESVNVQFGRCGNEVSAGTMETLWQTWTKYLHTGRKKWNTKTACRFELHQRSAAEKQNDYLTRGRNMFWILLSVQRQRRFEYISYCELFSYCFMCFMLLWPATWAFLWTWLSKFMSQIVYIKLLTEPQWP